MLDVQCLKTIVLYTYYQDFLFLVCLVFFFSSEKVVPILVLPSKLQVNITTISGGMIFITKSYEDF